MAPIQHPAIDRTRAGEDEATLSFEAACRAAWTPVVRLLVASLPAGADVENAAATCFEIAWRRRGTVANADLLPWLLGVAANVARNERRGIGRRIRLGERIRSVGASREQSPPADAEVADLDLGHAGAVLRTLRPDDRVVLVLHAWEDLDASQIADVLGISANAAAQRLSRARRRFEQAWERTAPDGGDAP